MWLPNFVRLKPCICQIILLVTSNLQLVQYVRGYHINFQLTGTKALNIWSKNKFPINKESVLNIAIFNWLSKTPFNWFWSLKPFLLVKQTWAQAKQICKRINLFVIGIFCSNNSWQWVISTESALIACTYACNAKGKKGFNTRDPQFSGLWLSEL